jgi:pimeloyl-ACP methyl ester carboxylesterase
MVADRPFHRLDLLAGINPPSLVIANEGDPLHPIHIAGAIAEALPAVGLRMVPSRYLSAPEHVAALRGEVRQFLDQLGEF